MITILGIAVFAAVLFKLVTTNHWTIGKKLLVCLTIGMLIELVGKLMIAMFLLPVAMYAIVQAPQILVGALMAYFFYRKESILG